MNYFEKKIVFKLIGDCLLFEIHDVLFILGAEQQPLYKRRWVFAHLRAWRKQWSAVPLPVGAVAAERQEDLWQFSCVRRGKLCV